MMSFWDNFQNARLSTALLSKLKHSFGDILATSDLQITEPGSIHKAFPNIDMKCNLLTTAVFFLGRLAQSLAKANLVSGAQSRGAGTNCEHKTDFSDEQPNCLGKENFKATFYHLHLFSFIFL